MVMGAKLLRTWTLFMVDGAIDTSAGNDVVRTAAESMIAHDFSGTLAGRFEPTAALPCSMPLLLLRLARLCDWR